MTESITVKGPIGVVLVDNHTIFLEVLRCLVSRCPGLEVVGIAANGLQAMERIETLRPKVVLMDVNMPKLNGIDATLAIKARFPEILVIGLSNNASEYRAAMYQAGASRVLEKEYVVEEICGAIREVIAESVVPDFMSKQEESAPLTLSSPPEAAGPLIQPPTTMDLETKSSGTVPELDHSQDKPPSIP